MSETQEFSIVAEPQMRPDQCKFNFETPLFERGIYFFDRKNWSKDSILADLLFQLDHVALLVVTKDSILVTQDSDLDWRELGKKIGQAIREAIQSGKNLISPELTRRTSEEDHLFEQVSSILNERVNPSIASHGGSIELVDVKKKDVFLKMAGGCQGCAMAAMTLRQGVERALRDAIPDLGAVYDTTLHEEGAHPYL